MLGDLRPRPCLRRQRPRPQRADERPGGVDEVDDPADNRFRQDPGRVRRRGHVGGRPLVQVEPFDGVAVAEPGLPHVQRVVAGRPVFHLPFRLALLLVHELGDLGDFVG